MAEIENICKCYACGSYINTDDCDKIDEDDIVTCMDEKKMILYEMCWSCNLTPCNSPQCKEYRESEAKAGRPLKQFKASEFFQ